MIYNVLLLASVLAMADGAVLLRFINTVPTSLANAHMEGFLTDAARRIATPQRIQDRVGLQYFADAVTTSGTTQTPTIVWTELLTASAGVEVLPGTAPHAWSHAMPSLRAYHTTQNDAAPAVNLLVNPAVDTVSPVGNVLSFVAAGAASTAGSSFNDDYYEHTHLKADGVGLYLSFAPGTYRMQAYVVRSAVATAAFSNPVQTLPATASVFTFEDNRVYTLVAIGDGRYTATVPLTGNDISLRLFEESTAPTTFGKASVRFFHAIKTSKADTITVYNSDAAAAAPLAQNIAFGALSNYVDLVPNTRQVFAITASSTGTTLIAPTTAAKLEVTHDIRSGLRATVICAVNNEATTQVFCRLIPSRIVAYVRLVNDLAGHTGVALGSAGAEPLSSTNITLWASYEFPRPDQVVEGSQTGGIRTVTNTPANIRGLYKVVNNVAPNSVSGYGEVFVPLIIMDFAVRYTVVIDNSLQLGTAGLVLGAGAAAAAADTNQAKPVLTDATTMGAYTWFIGAPIFKRVHFVVRTSSGATLSGVGSTQLRFDTTLGTNGWLQAAALLDRSVEPGAWFTLIVAPRALPIAVSGMQVGTDVRFFWRHERTINQIASPPATGKAGVNLILFGEQDFTNNGAGGVLAAGTFNLNIRPKVAGVTGNQVITPVGANQYALVSTGATSTTALEINSNKWGDDITINAGDYTFDYTTTATVNCINSFPGSFDLSAVKDGELISIFVLNQIGCAITGTNNPNALVVRAVRASSAVATGNADGTLLSNTVTPTTTTTTFFAAAPALSVSMSLVIAAIFAAVAALL